MHNAGCMKSGKAAVVPGDARAVTDRSLMNELITCVSLFGKEEETETKRMKPDSHLVFHLFETKV